MKNLRTRAFDALGPTVGAAAIIFFGLSLLAGVVKLVAHLGLSIL